MSSLGFVPRFLANSRTEILSDDKSRPYLSLKNIGDISAIESFNCKVEKNGITINCCHLSTCFLLNSVNAYKSGKKMDFMGLFGSREAILKINPEIMGSKCRDIEKNACGRHIVSCRNFGNFLCNIATNTAVDEQRFFFMGSINHLMTFSIRHKIKKKLDGTSKNRYVISFFEPNVTNVKVRSAVNNPYDFLCSKFYLEQFIESSFYLKYFENLPKYPKEEECIVHEFDDTKVASRGFTTLDLASGTISECVLHHLMFDDNDASSILKMSKEFYSSKLSRKKIESILFCRSSGGNPGLFAALSNNNVSAIFAYGTLLDGLSSDESIRLLPELLLANNIENVPGLFFAIIEDYDLAIYAFGGLFDRLLLLADVLPENELLDIIFKQLSSCSYHNITGLYAALYYDRFKATTAFGILLDKVIAIRHKFSDDFALIRMLFKVMMATTNDGIAGLSIALQNNHFRTIDAFGFLLEKVLLLISKTPQHKINESQLVNDVSALLGAKNSSGESGLYLALQNNCSNAVLSFVNILEKVSYILQGKLSERVLCHIIFEILVAKSNSAPGLSVALMKDSNCAVFAFGDLLGHMLQLLVNAKNVAPDEIKNAVLLLLTAVDCSGVPGLNVALRYNSYRSVSAFAGLIERLSVLEGVLTEDVIADLVFEILLAKCRNGVTALHAAFKNSHLESIYAYESLLSKVSSCKFFTIADYKMVTMLVAQDENGLPGIVLTDNESTINFYFSMLKNFSDTVFLKSYSKLKHIKESRECLAIVSSDVFSERLDNFLAKLEEHKRFIQPHPKPRLSKTTKK